MKLSQEQVDKLRNATVAYEGKLLQDYLLLCSNTEESNYTLLLNELKTVEDKINDIRPPRSFLAKNPEIKYFLNQLKACLQIRAEEYKEAEKTLRLTVCDQYTKDGIYEGRSWQYFDFKDIRKEEKKRFYHQLRWYGGILRFRWNPEGHLYRYIYLPIKKIVEKGEQAQNPFVHSNSKKVYDYCSRITRKLKSVNPSMYEQQSIDGLIEYISIILPLKPKKSEPTNLGDIFS